ncbi:hypothetical protein BDV59DRAFT_179250 [Aspergillus ambiguus]|uniref:uncharacterized protein n=1 Tax=Aspergillus ambiguus TaxID=176160 RepID=UPI003CCD7534
MSPVQIWRGVLRDASRCCLTCTDILVCEPRHNLGSAIALDSSARGSTSRRLRPGASGLLFILATQENELSYIMSVGVVRPHGSPSRPLILSPCGIYSG